MKPDKDISNLFSKARNENVHASFDETSGRFLEALNSGATIPKMKKSFFWSGKDKLAYG